MNEKWEADYGTLAPGYMCISAVAGTVVEYVVAAADTTSSRTGFGCYYYYSCCCSVIENVEMDITAGEAEQNQNLDKSLVLSSLLHVTAV